MSFFLINGKGLISYSKAESVDCTVCHRFCFMFLKHHEMFLHIGCLIERVEEVTSGPSAQLICGILGSFVIMMGCLYNIIHSSGSSTAIQKPDSPSRNKMYFCK